MSQAAPRVAFFTDSFHEVNGVALTSRQFEAFARRRGYPFFSAHTGPETRVWTEDSITRCELALGRMTVPLESDLHFDTTFLRLRGLVGRAIDDFKPDIVHITGPSSTGLLGLVAARGRRIPLAASWHTNIHEYGGRRLERLLGFLPESWSRAAGRGAEAASLAATLRFYRFARVTLAPNPELVRLIEKGAQRPCFQMRRGVDTEMFHPAHRDRADGVFTLGYIGRTSTEKNVQHLVDVERALREAGVTNYRIFVAGHGSLLDWLRENLQQREVPGVLRGEALARAYANLDLFVFPSETDTYGNVVQEAMASGVPCVVTDQGGPAHIVTHGLDGLIAPAGPRFCEAVVQLARDPERRRQMAEAARATALKASWDSVFDEVYQAYAHALGPLQLR